MLFKTVQPNNILVSLTTSLIKIQLNIPWQGHDTLNTAYINIEAW